MQIGKHADFDTVESDDDDFDAINDAIFRQRATVPISTRGACNYHFSHQ